MELISAFGLGIAVEISTFTHAGLKVFTYQISHVFRESTIIIPSPPDSFPAEPYIIAHQPITLSSKGLFPE